jgi:tRNA-dihydrouridine synthase A
MLTNTKNSNITKAYKNSENGLEPHFFANSMDRRISVAPMMGCTDRHCRALLRLISPNSLLFSEMIVTGALIHGDAQHYLKHARDEPCALQLGGSDPVALRQCATMVEDAGYQEINLNVGCPSDRVQYGGIGACLMAEPKLVAECLHEMQEQVNIPVTIKCRIGIDEYDSYEFFHNFVQEVAKSGCEVFYIHARSAILEGLSPKENREIPPLKYDYVYKIKNDFPHLQFFINGAIKTTQQVVEQLSKVDGVMMGRVPYHDPYLLAEIERQIFNFQSPSRLEIVSQFIQYGQETLVPGEHPKHIIKHLLGLFLGCTGAKKYRRYLSDHMFDAKGSLDIVFDALKHAELA